MAPGGSAVSKRISGEGRVTYIRPTHAFLAKPGLDGGIFVVPSSIMGQQSGYPDMSQLLCRNDLVKFDAEPQEERNGIKWVALDGSVKVIGKASDIQIKGMGTVTKVDERYGQYGFIESDKGGIFFNANVVRPETQDITKVLKKGQKVQFEAIEQKNQPQCKFRATLVHLKSWKPPMASPAAATTATVHSSAANPQAQSQIQNRPQQQPGGGSSNRSAPFNQSIPPRLQQAQSTSGLPPADSPFQTLANSSYAGSSDSSRASTPGHAPSPPPNVNSTPAGSRSRNGPPPSEVFRSTSSSPFSTPAGAGAGGPPPPYRVYPNVLAPWRIPAIPKYQPLDIILSSNNKNLIDNNINIDNNDVSDNANGVNTRFPIPKNGSPFLAPVVKKERHAHRQAPSDWLNIFRGPSSVEESSLGEFGGCSAIGDGENGGRKSGGSDSGGFGTVEDLDLGKLDLGSGSVQRMRQKWISVDEDSSVYERESARFRQLAHDYAGVGKWEECEVCQEPDKL